MKKFLLFFVVFLIFILSSMGSIESDAQASVNAAMNFVNGKGFQISPPDYNQGIQVIVGKDGKYYNGAGLVGNLIYVPPAFLAKTIHTLRNDPPIPLFPLQADYLDTFLSSFVTIIFGFLLFIVNYKLFKLITKKEKTAFLLALIISFSTNLFPLAKHALYHVPYIFFVMWSFYLMLSYLKNENKNYLIFSGAVMGISLLTYNLSSFIIQFFFALFLSVCLYFDKKKSFKETLFSLILWICSSIPFILLMGYYNFARFGNPFVTGYDPNSYDLTAKGNLLEGLWGLLLSPGRSIFIYSPVLLMAVYLGVKNFKKNRYSQLFLILFVFFLLFYGRLIIWHGELSWGPRYMLILVPFAGLVFASLWSKVNKLIFIILMIIGLFVQFEGITVAYQIQYGPYDSAVINTNNVTFDRKAIFEYYEIGQFIPRFAPVNRFKKGAFNRWFQVKNVLFQPNKLDLIYGSSLPIVGVNGLYKHLKSEFYMYAFDTIAFKKLQLDIRSVNQPITKVEICIPSKHCYQSSKVVRNSENPNLYEVFFDRNILVEKNTYLMFLLNKSNSKQKNEFKLDLYGMKYNDIPIEINSYRRVNTDSSFVRNTPIQVDYKDIDTLWKIRNEIQEVVNITGDFWWIKTAIYYNLPGVFRYSFYTIIVLLILSLLLLIFWKKKEK